MSITIPVMVEPPEPAIVTTRGRRFLAAHLAPADWSGRHRPLFTRRQATEILDWLGVAHEWRDHHLSIVRRLGKVEALMTYTPMGEPLYELVLDVEWSKA